VTRDAGAELGGAIAGKIERADGVSAQAVLERRPSNSQWVSLHRSVGVGLAPILICIAHLQLLKPDRFLDCRMAPQKKAESKTRGARR
jgi:hypothetical protein